MTCFLVNEKNELFVGLAIEKFISVELKNGEIIINNIIHLPADKILEIKIDSKEEDV